MPVNWRRLTQGRQAQRIEAIGGNLASQYATGQMTRSEARKFTEVSAEEEGLPVRKIFTAANLRILHFKQWSDGFDHLQALDFEE